MHVEAATVKRLEVEDSLGGYWRRRPDSNR